MNTLTITIALILVTLASTIVSVLRRGTATGKLVLVVLAVCSSGGAIYLAHETDRRAQSSTRAQELLMFGADSAPIGFEDALGAAVQQIAVQEGYGEAHLHETHWHWRSDHFGYVVAFSLPSDTRPPTGYDELALMTGLAHAFAYLPKSSVLELVSKFIKDSDLKQPVEDHIFWTWEEVDMTDERFLQSMRGIAYMAYMSLTSTQRIHDVQRRPEEFWIDLDIDDDKSVTVLATHRDHVGQYGTGGYVLSFMPWARPG